MPDVSVALHYDFAQAGIPATEIRQELDRIVASPAFAHSQRMRSFLTYVVNERLAGRERRLKEYAIALNVYDKPASFDPRVDSIIRVEASRLRKKLQKYYSGEGREDPVLIRVSPNSYIPEFVAAGDMAPSHALDNAGTELECLCLKAAHFLNRRDPESLAAAVRSFTTVAATEPGFSIGMAGLAECYTEFAWQEFNAPEAVWGSAILYARRALQKSPDITKALTILACEKAAYRWNWVAAEEEFQRTIKSEPNCPKAYQWYAMFCLAPQGRLDEALLYLNRARRLEPDSAVTACHIGRIAYLKRRYSEALHELDQCIRLNPRFFPAYCDLGLVYAQLEDWKHASAALAAARDLADRPLVISGLGYVAGLSGCVEAALEARALLMELSTSHYVSPVNLALIDVGLGDFDNAFESLYRALDLRAARIIQVPVDPAFDRIKTDPRFVRILTRLAV